MNLSDLLNLLLHNDNWKVSNQTWGQTVIDCTWPRARSGYARKSSCATVDKSHLLKNALALRRQEHLLWKEPNNLQRRRAFVGKALENQQPQDVDFSEKRTTLPSKRHENNKHIVTNGQRTTYQFEHDYLKQERKRRKINKSQPKKKTLKGTIPKEYKEAHQEKRGSSAMLQLEERSLLTRQDV